jgi:hypothetical protein
MLSDSSGPLAVYCSNASTINCNVMTDTRSNSVAAVNAIPVDTTSR